MKFFLLPLLMSIAIVSGLGAADPDGLTETKKVNGHTVTVFVEPLSTKMIILVYVYDVLPFYDDIAVGGSDDAGSEVTGTRLFPQAVKYGSLYKGTGVGTYKVVLEGGHTLRTVKVSWGNQTVSFAVKPQFL